MKITAHARERMAERGITDRDITGAIKLAVRKWKSKNGTIVFESATIRVVIDPQWPVNVVTVCHVTDPFLS